MKFPNRINETCCVATGRTGTNFVYDKVKGYQGFLVHDEKLHPVQSYVDWDARDLIPEQESISQEGSNEMARTDKGRLSSRGWKIADLSNTAVSKRANGG